MSRQDYIMRMVEQLSMVIAQVLGLKRDHKLQESHEILNDALNQILGLSSKTAELLTYRDLVRLISRGDKIDTERCLVLAGLLKEKADVYIAENSDPAAFNLYFKSLNLFIEALIANEELRNSTNVSKVDEIIQIIEAVPIPTDSGLLLFKYYELTGRFARAEDMLFELLSSNNYDGSTVESGLAFYQRLLAKEEAELLEGDLPIAEVREAYAELCKHI